MNDVSRRLFLTRASLGAVAGLAASTAVALPRLASTAASAVPEAESLLPDLTPIGEDVVALIRNASAGELAIMSGTREVVIRDPQIVGRILAAARQLTGEE